MGGYIGATAVGLTTTAADVQGDITSTDTTPEVILKNTTETDADGSRDGKITFKGEQSGGEESVLAQIQSSHDGTADDQKGDLIFRTNDGSDGASPTEAMRIQSDQKIGIGVNDPDADLDISGGSNKLGILRVTQRASGAAAYGLDVGLDPSTGDPVFSRIVNDTVTEAMRIQRSTGNVGIGTADPLRQLHISNTSANSEIAFTAATNGVSSILFGDGQTGTDVYRGYLQYNHSDDAMLFASSAAERMRIDSNGKLLIGKTSDAAAPTGFIFGAGNVGAYSTISSGNTWHVHDTSNYKFYVSVNGGIANYQSNNVNLSDQREKKNIGTLDNKWDAVKAWTLKKFHYNSDEDSDAKRFGVIAQDLETDHPELIANFILNPAQEEIIDDDGNVTTEASDAVTRKSVKEQQMMWMAIKALQEAMAKIETLETKVAALEGE